MVFLVAATFGRSGRKLIIRPSQLQYRLPGTSQEAVTLNRPIPYKSEVSSVG
jgi:hypothetical protein